jgi:3',5'-cyclic AMP phosphodiesterase CpdA
VEFSLAHFSDVHLGPLPRGAILKDFALKRVIGGLSWNWHRRHIHLPEVAAALRADILSVNPNHIAFTGDLTNIAAESEFIQGQKWLNEFGDGNLISFTPGNHDAYVPIAWDKSIGRLSPYMTSDMRQAEAFPYVRLRRNIALIGLNTAQPQNYLAAGGTVGPEQRQRLAETLRSLHERGFYRVVMIHHPPAPGLATPIRALSDAAEMKTLLETVGAELVLHGHNHEKSLNFLENKNGQIPVVGVPSASMTKTSQHDIAAWNFYSISRSKSQWHTKVKIRCWNADIKMMQDQDAFDLPPRT